jgi:hypothetical protein
MERECSSPAGGDLLSSVFYRNTDSLEEPQPAVMVTGSWLTVKEQMPEIYARRLAAADRDSNAQDRQHHRCGGVCFDHVVPAAEWRRASRHLRQRPVHSGGHRPRRQDPVVRERRGLVP